MRDIRKIFKSGKNFKFKGKVITEDDIKETNMEQLEILKKRLDKIGIDVEFVANFPWIYLYKINGQLVKERYEAEHGFTIAFLPVRRDKPFHFTELNVIFKLIRKYCA